VLTQKAQARIPARPSATAAYHIAAGSVILSEVEGRARCFSIGT
jgi:hypothetical protein